MANEPDALVESFPGEPELDDPHAGASRASSVQGVPHRGEDVLARHNVSVEDVGHVVTERRGFQEAVLRVQDLTLERQQVL